MCPVVTSEVEQAVLLFTVGARLCAIGVESVAETMRPLPLEAAVKAAPFVAGTSLVRGEPTPVLDMHVLLGEAQDEVPARLILLRFDDRQVGLLVSSVVGVRGLDAMATRDLPPLLVDASAGQVELLGRLDDRLVTVLRAARLLPLDVAVPER